MSFSRGVVPIRMSLNILHFNSGNLFGGVEAFMGTMANTHVPGMESEFGLCFEGKAADVLRAAGATVHRFPEVRFSRPWTVLQARREARRLIRARRPTL